MLMSQVPHETKPIEESKNEVYTQGLLEVRSNTNRETQNSVTEELPLKQRSKVLGTKTQAQAEEILRQSYNSTIEIPDDLCLVDDYDVVD